MAERPARIGFRQIAAEYAARIGRGELLPGTCLPAERALAARLGVNRSTVVAAYEELRAAGLVDRRQGSGTTVRGDLWGVAPVWQRYMADAGFRPTGPLQRRIRAARGDPGTIDLAQGVAGGDLLPSDTLQRLLRDLMLPIDFGYPGALGDLRLRAAIADAHRRRHGAAVDPDMVLVTTGAQQAQRAAPARGRPGRCRARCRTRDDVRWAGGRGSSPCSRRACRKRWAAESGRRFQSASSHPPG